MLEKSVLYIAYHYPPIIGSSGVHRTLAFTRYLAEQDWRVTLLSASLKTYPNWSEDQLSFIPDNVNLVRTFALETTKHLSLKGRYFGWMALPDNLQSWIVPAVLSGLKQIRTHQHKVIVSTYPIASAHIIGYCLHKLTGLPWIADFRDPMAQDDYPSDPQKKKVFEWIEKKAVQHCTKVVFTCPGAKVFYQQKFPQVDDELWAVIPNGFDETIFADVLAQQPAATDTTDKPLTLLHSGVVYPAERDPTQLFEAISQLKQSGQISSDTLQIRLRATGHDHLYQPRLDALNISDIVILSPPILYKEALREMLSADALLLLQADNCNYQVPAKAYEYIRANRPILALTDPRGDTGELMKIVGLGKIAPLDNTEAIKTALIQLLAQLNQGVPSLLDETTINDYSRQKQALRFTGLLTDAVTGKSTRACPQSL